MAVPDEEAEVPRGEGINLSGKMAALFPGQPLPLTSLGTLYHSDSKISAYLGTVAWAPWRADPSSTKPPHNHCAPSLEVNTLPVDLESRDLASSPSSTVLPWASHLTSLCLSFLTCKTGIIASPSPQAYRMQGM